MNKHVYLLGCQKHKVGAEVVAAPDGAHLLVSSYDAPVIPSPLQAGI